MKYDGTNALEVCKFLGPGYRVRFEDGVFAEFEARRNSILLAIGESLTDLGGGNFQINKISKFIVAFGVKTKVDVFIRAYGYIAYTKHCSRFLNKSACSLTNRISSDTLLAISITCGVSCTNGAGDSCPNIEHPSIRQTLSSASASNSFTS